MTYLARFFGDQSPFQIIVAVVAFTTAAYTFYKSFLEGARIRLFPGDRVGLVLSANGGCTKFHLRGSLANHAVKTGTLHRLEAQITTPAAVIHSYEWNLFFTYVPGSLSVQPAGNPIPVSVSGRSSQLLLVEFRLTAGTSIPAWSAGRYLLKIVGWVNRANRSCAINLDTVIHFSLDAAQAHQLCSQAPGQDVVIDFPIEEWVP